MKISLEATKRTPKAPCPHCGAELSAITGDRTPEPGDSSICLECAELLTFDNDLRPRKPTHLELIEAQRSAAWPKLQFLQRKVREFQEIRSRESVESEEFALSLGACCNCGIEGPSVRNILMLDLRSPEPGLGCWGCLACCLPQAGAVAVLCDSCMEKSHGLPERACLGSPADNRRIPIEQLTEKFEHDMTKHLGGNGAMTVRSNVVND